MPDVDGPATSRIPPATPRIPSATVLTYPATLCTSQVVLIVDEVDDLVVNEKPSLLYNCTDASLTPHYRACYTALLTGEGKPPKLDKVSYL